MSKDLEAKLIGLWAYLHYEPENAEVISQAVQHIQSLQSEVEALRNGIRAVVKQDVRSIGNTDKCSHGKYGFEECESCLCDYLQGLLASDQNGG